MNTMHALLTSVGTDGDVFPYLGLGARLRSRGHRVTLVTNECYRAAALEHGFAFHALISASVRGSRKLARMLCGPQRQVMASIKLGPAPQRARSIASPTT